MHTEGFIPTHTHTIETTQTNFIRIISHLSTFIKLNLLCYESVINNNIINKYKIYNIILI